MKKTVYSLIAIMMLIQITMGTVSAKDITIPPCTDLLSIGSEPHMIDKREVMKHFKKSAEDWTENDFDSLRKSYFTCDIPDYYNKNDYVGKVVNNIKGLMPKIHKYDVFLAGKVISATKNDENYIVTVSYKNFKVGNRKSSGKGTFVVPNIGIGIQGGDNIKANFIAASKDGYSFDYSFISWDKEFEDAKKEEKAQFDKKVAESNEKAAAIRNEIEKKYKEKIDTLIAKWKDSGTTEKILSSKFSTNSGIAVTELCTVVEFIENLKGELSWEKLDNGLWVLHQNVVDDMTKKKAVVSWGFYDNTVIPGKVFLGRLIIDGNEAPQSKLVHFVTAFAPGIYE